MPNRKPYPTDVSEEEWAFVAPYLALVRQDAPQRTHDLRDIFDALRWILRAGAPWRMLPHDFPPWEAVYQQTQRWIAAGVFEAMVHDLREVLRLAQGRAPEPSAAASTAARCAPRPRAVHAEATMGRSARRAPRSTRPSTRSGTCWRCASVRPTSRTARR